MADSQHPINDPKYTPGYWGALSRGFWNGLSLGTADYARALNGEKGQSYGDALIEAQRLTANSGVLGTVGWLAGTAAFTIGTVLTGGALGGAAAARAGIGAATTAAPAAATAVATAAPFVAPVFPRAALSGVAATLPAITTASTGASVLGATAATARTTASVVSSAAKFTYANPGVAIGRTLGAVGSVSAIDGSLASMKEGYLGAHQLTEEEKRRIAEQKSGSHDVTDAHEAKKPSIAVAPDGTKVDTSRARVME